MFKSVEMLITVLLAKLKLPATSIWSLPLPVLFESLKARMPPLDVVKLAGWAVPVAKRFEKV